MKTYIFTIVCLDVTHEDLENSDAYISCNDALLSSSGGIVTLEFAREANSFEESFNSALNDIKRLGFGVDMEATKKERLKDLLS